jgi:hypothetical protein
MDAMFGTRKVVPKCGTCLEMERLADGIENL